MLDFSLRNLSRKQIATALRAGKITMSHRILLEDVITGWDLPPDILIYFAWRVAAQALEKAAPMLDGHDPEFLGKLRDLMNLQQGLLDLFDEGAGKPKVWEVVQAWGAVWETTHLVEDIKDVVTDHVQYDLSRCVLNATGQLGKTNPVNMVDRVVGNYYCVAYNLELADYEGDDPGALETEVCQREEVWVNGLLADLIEKHVPEWYNVIGDGRKNKS